VAGLRQYRAKRDFGATQEPRGAVRRQGREDGHAYVIQEHAARRLHYDLRLELDGVLKSWAVTRGPSLDPLEKRLAVEVEDHPVEYAGFEGTIPQGQYGGGKVIVWDRGTWTPEGDPHRGLAKGHLDFLLDGEKLHGRWHLVRMRPRQGDKHNNWLLIKGRDEFAAAGRDADIVDLQSASVLTGRQVGEVGEGDRVWDSNKGELAPPPEAAAMPTARGAIATPKRGARLTAAAKHAPGEADRGKRRGKNESSEQDNRSRTGKRATAPAAGRATQAMPSGAAVGKVKRAKITGAVEDATASAARQKLRFSELPGAARAPMPEFNPPCLATLMARPPEGDRFVHEIKFDGYRLQAHIKSVAVRLYTRSGLDWTAKFGTELAAALRSLAAADAIIDGELVVEGETGASDFSLLQAALSDGATSRFVFYAFDLLYADGCDLREVPLVERKEALHALLPAGGAGPLRYSEHFTESGALVLEHACRMSLEGIISKRVASSYRSGRSTDWIKSKCFDRQEFVIAGFVPSSVANGAIGSLALGYNDGGQLVYAGRVGTGFPEKTARDLFRKLQAIRTDPIPFAGKLATAERRGVIWVRPELVAEVEFRGWTGAKLLRQASFRGLREDKAPGEVVREMPAAPFAAAARGAGQVGAKGGEEGDGEGQAVKGNGRQRKTAAVRSAGPRGASFGVKLTHPDRIYWPDAGVTKLGLAEYYAQAWKWIAPHVVRRPLSLLRCPDGIGEQCFFQKQPWQGLHQSITVLPNPGPGGDHLLAIDSLDGLVALVQAGVLEIHPWGASLADLDRPDRLIFDLDPGPDVPWSVMADTANEVRERLKRDRLASFVKTTGGKGLHVVAPLTPKADWDEVKAYAHRLAEAMIGQHPELYAPTMAKRERTGRIFIDYLRNGQGATAVAPYSTRARPGAPVSTPIAWDELPGISGSSFHLSDVPNRLAQQRSDPWARFFKIKQTLPTTFATQTAGDT
jgi:bifunctional non-homologous end joining protein LigD